VLPSTDCRELLFICNADVNNVCIIIIIFIIDIIWLKSPPPWLWSVFSVLSFVISSNATEWNAISPQVVRKKRASWRQLVYSVVVAECRMRGAHFACCSPPSGSARIAARLYYLQHLQCVYVSQPARPQVCVSENVGCARYSSKPSHSRSNRQMPWWWCELLLLYWVAK